MSSARAISLELTPAAAPDLKVNTYTYDAQKVRHDAMAEEVSLGISAAHMHLLVEITPDEARVLANQLLQVADTCEEARDRRVSFEHLSDEMRDADEAGGTGSCCLYAHPDVHYVPEAQLVAKVRELEASGLRRWMVLPEPEHEQMPATEGA